MSLGTKKSQQTSSQKSATRARNIKNDYLLRTREKGSGPRRIGYPIPLTEDIYSMFFATCLKTEFIYFHQETNSEKNPQKFKELRKELKKKEKEQPDRVTHEIVELDCEKNAQREFLSAEAFIVFSIQLIMSYCIWSTTDMPTDQTAPPNFYVSFTRVIAGLVLQVVLARELNEGLIKMKYSLNHSWKFDAPH